MCGIGKPEAARPVEQSKLCRPFSLVQIHEMISGSESGEKSLVN